MGSVFGSQPTPYKTEQEGSAANLGEIGRIGTRFGKKESKMGMKSFKQLFPYFKNLLSGDRGKMTEMLAPELRETGAQYDTASRNMAEFGPRGGGTNSAVSNLQNQKAGQVSDLYTKARPYAAQGLQNLGGMMTQAGTANLGMAGQAYGNQGSIYGNLGNLVQKERERKSAAWAGLGSGIGSLLGGGLAPGGFLR